MAFKFTTEIQKKTRGEKDTSKIVREFLKERNIKIVSSLEEKEVKNLLKTMNSFRTKTGLPKMNLVFI